MMILPMTSSIFFKLLWLACTAALCATTLLFAGASFQQGVPQGPASSATKAPVYFPPDAVDGFNGFFSSYLHSFDEPSLLAAAQDSNALSYRLDWMASQRWVVLAVRLFFDADGTAKVTSIVQSGAPAVFHRTQNSVSAEDAKKFMQMLEKADFWSMPTMEQEKPSKGPKAYKLDASPWIFEGVCNGRYHVVLRLSPEPSAFTEMVRFLSQGISESSMSPSFPTHVPPRRSTLESNTRNLLGRAVATNKGTGPSVGSLIEEVNP
jgi:hypothetical protein